MIDPRWRSRLEDMAAYARDALAFGAGHDAASLEADRMRLFAIIRAIEVIGEAAARIDPAFRASQPQFPWPQIIGMRNTLVHGYGRIRTTAVVATVRDHIPTLIIELDKLLNNGAQG